MIKEIKAYEANCDKCGEALQDEEEYPIVSPTLENLRARMDGNEWQTIDGKDYCENCKYEMEEE